MRIFITGGSGFIGTHVVSKLEKNKKDKLFVLKENLTNIDKWQDNLKLFRPDVAIHLAWEGIPDYSVQMSLKNLEYGLNLFQVLAKTGCRKIIGLGSCWEYGQKQGKLCEDMPILPVNAFTAAKNTLHWLGREIALENRIQFIWTRLFYVYGPGQRKESLIPYLINCIEKGEIPKIKTFQAKNDYIYVEDVAEALIKIIEESKSNGVYNIGFGKAVSVNKICSTVYKQFYKNKKDDFCKCRDHPLGENKHKPDNFWADITKIKKEIGWKPRIDIKQGIQKTIESSLKETKK